jgi:hypothetical protein
MHRHCRACHRHDVQQTAALAEVKNALAGAAQLSDTVQQECGAYCCSNDVLIAVPVAAAALPSRQGSRCGQRSALVYGTLAPTGEAAYHCLLHERQLFASPAHELPQLPQDTGCVLHL